jgi:hypothetical protein
MADTPAFMGEDLLEKQAASRAHADDTFDFPDAGGAKPAPKPAKKAAKKKG